MDKPEFPLKHGGSNRVLRGLYRLAQIAYQAGLALVVHEGFEMSGYAAFTAILSLFPFLLFLTALAGFLGDREVASSVLAGALEFAPSEVVDVLRPVILEVLTQRHGSLLTVGIVFALWSASSGVEALRTILNRSYGSAETRPIWVLRPQSLVIVVFGAMLALSISSILIFGPLLFGVLDRIQVFHPLNTQLWAVLRYGIAGAIVTAALIALHLILPNRHLSIAQVAVGAVVTTLLWLIGAGLFSVYVENFAHFSLTYGSLGGIILTLLFFYLTAIIFAYGAEVNAQLHHSVAERQYNDPFSNPDDLAPNDLADDRAQRAGPAGPVALSPATDPGRDPRRDLHRPGGQ